MKWRSLRRIIELIQAVVILGLPFVVINGESALRFDIPEMRLHFLGTVIWINEFYLVLLLALFLILLMVTVTNAFGRLWCGWLCPMTVILDLTSDMSIAKSGRRAGLIRRLTLIPLTAVVSISLIWYFVPPAEALSGLFKSKVVTGFFLAQWAVIYAVVAFMGRRFCTLICPYSMLQNGLFDRNTLVVEFDAARADKCMGCDKCVVVCPVGIDIKKGLRRECIACAECVDACKSMTVQRGARPFIGYRGIIIKPMFFLLGISVLLSAIAFASAVYQRPKVAFVVAREPAAPSKYVNSYSYMLQNNTGRSYDLAIEVRGGFALIGESRIVLAPYTKIRESIMVRAETRPAKGEATFIIKGEGLYIERSAGYL